MQAELDGDETYMGPCKVLFEDCKKFLIRLVKRLDLELEMSEYHSPLCAFSCSKIKLELFHPLRDQQVSLREARMQVQNKHSPPPGRDLGEECWWGYCRPCQKTVASRVWRESVLKRESCKPIQLLHCDLPVDSVHLGVLAHDIQ